MMKSFATLQKAHADFVQMHPVATTLIHVTSTIAALVAIDTAVKLASRPTTVNIYYTKSES